MDNVKWLKTPRSGVLLSVASSFLVSACSVGVKVSNTPVGEITFITYLVLFITSVLLSFNTNEKLFPKIELPLLWGRTVFSLPIVIFSYKAVRLLPISDEALIAYTSIIFTIILGRICLGEKCDKNKLTASTGILTGVFLITVGPAPVNSNYLNGCIFSLLGALCDACSYIVLKELVHLHYSVILFNYSLSSLILTAPFYFIEEWTCDFIPLFALSILGTLQELFITLALTTEQAGVVCMIHASDIIFSYGWELSLFNETYTFAKITGALLVSLSVIFSAYLPQNDDIALSEENHEEKQVSIV
ncbi:hypothetical protein O3M35_009239 [Rhynocoris fuscipes]|uniref:EamA domain-containing protein n=1 Tax=Rhynocoris fuscipes TaxID=488301 RepID=A0AAW1D7J0_9HEMI